MSQSTVLYDTPGPRARRLYRIIGALTVIGLIVLGYVVVNTLADNGQLEYEGVWEPFVTPAFLEILWGGLLDTLRAAVFAIIGALIFGVIFGIGKLSEHRFVRWPCWLIVEFFRAVPLLILIVFLWSLYSLQLDRSFQALVIGLVLYNGSVLAEVFRAGINAVPKGQAEAAYALGMRKYQVMGSILMPQAVKIMLPSIISQCIVALKDTSLGFVILAPGLTTVGRQIWRQFGNYLATALVLLVIYLVINLLLDWLGRWVERRYTGGRRLDVSAVGVLGEQERLAQAQVEAARQTATMGGSGVGGTTG
ncbi:MULTISPECIES: amino acid ABC transporter permease [Mumia]|uniref:amino acid ABC transporter permease n=1 Tax=Mumia TaxID=1546255 RepID=UPI001424A4E6|nr:MULTISPECIES: amino acid ABC transporter permease [unclassified Mumia]QMW64964.1 amino acid ABC transporter permease [Mumia sp. ZJ1417]